MEELKIEEKWFLSLKPAERLLRGWNWGQSINEMQKQSTGRDLMLERFAEEVRRSFEGVKL